MVDTWTPRKRPGHKSYELSDEVLQQKYFKLTSAEIKALKGTPITVIPAPGPGKYVQFVGAVLFLNHGGTDYANGGDLSFQMNSTDVSVVVANSAFVNSSADACINLPADEATYALAENDGVEITVASAEHITGDGTITGLVSYRIVSFDNEV